jgi:hypothetical protein
MSEVQDAPRSAVVFGARNLGRAVIETLVANGWAVAGVSSREAPSTAYVTPERLR